MISVISILSSRIMSLSLNSIKVNPSIFSTKSMLCPQKRSLITISSKLARPPQKKAKRLGRGGKGKTAGRGRKGWHAKHSQSRMLRAHEGGQSSIAKRFPKIGIQAKGQVKELKRVLRPFSLEKLQAWIDLGRIDPSKPITMKEICQSGIAGKVKNGAVLLSSGSRFFKHKIDIQVTKASQPAIKAIEALGGRVTTVYTDREVIRSILRPEKYAEIPDVILPPTKRLVAIYSDETRRGYLHPVIKNAERKDIMKSILEKVGLK